MSVHNHHLPVFGTKPKVPAMSSSHLWSSWLHCYSCSLTLRSSKGLNNLSSIYNATQNSILLENQCNTFCCLLSSLAASQFSNSGQTIRNSIKHSWFLWGSWTKSSMHTGICRTRIQSTSSAYPASLLTVTWTLWPQSKLYESAHRCWQKLVQSVKVQI